MNNPISYQLVTKDVALYYIQSHKCVQVKTLKKPTGTYKILQLFFEGRFICYRTEDFLSSPLPGVK